MITREECVYEIREAASDWGREALECDEASLASAYAQDALDLNMVADLLEEGCGGQAATYAHELDTIVRECLSNDIWDFLDNFLLERSC